MLVISSSDFETLSWISQRGSDLSNICHEVLMLEHYDRSDVWLCSGAGGQRLRPCGGLVGSGSGDVRDDVRTLALLQSGPRAALRAHRDGGDPFPQEPLTRSQSAADRPAEERPQTEVNLIYTKWLEQQLKNGFKSVISIFCCGVSGGNISLHFQTFIWPLIVIIQWDFCASHRDVIWSSSVCLEKKHNKLRLNPEELCLETIQYCSTF